MVWTMPDRGANLATRRGLVVDMIVHPNRTSEAPMPARSKPKSSPKPPKAYQEFIKKFPELGQAWELIGQAGRKGPLDERTARLMVRPGP